MLYEPSGFRPHSSPDPFGATLSPGEGIWRNILQKEIKKENNKRRNPPC